MLPTYLTLERHDRSLCLKYDRDASWDEDKELPDDDGELGSWSSSKEDEDMVAFEIPVAPSGDDE